MRARHGKPRSDEIRFRPAPADLAAARCCRARSTRRWTLEPAFHRMRCRHHRLGSLCAGQRQAELSARGDQARLGIILLVAARGRHPVIIGSAGTAGIDSQVDWLVDIADEIAKEKAFRSDCGGLFRAVEGIPARPDQVAADPVADPAPHLDEHVIREHRARRRHDGRRAAAGGSSTAAPNWCGRPLFRRGAVCGACRSPEAFPEGLAWHAGKVMECGTQVCVKARRGIVYATMTKDDFMLRSSARTSPSRRKASRRIPSTRTAIPTSTTSRRATWTCGLHLRPAPKTAA